MPLNNTDRYDPHDRCSLHGSGGREEPSITLVRSDDNSAKAGYSS
ncbi:hypothetical protein AtDm6_2807 [Acetobacter tropicalis]|uniref:Uncharacterized protein n=1 Tax=Acetobacter tropicalis TaxID=104102 RepID=A0A094YLI0_9PROT|nr:hypothetical protein AtDm6_2807 [Acetobacter tropicalis]